MLDDRIFHASHPFNRDNLFYEVNPLPIYSTLQFFDENNQVRYLSDPEPISQMADIFFFDFIITHYRSGRDHRWGLPTTRGRQHVTSF